MPTIDRDTYLDWRDNLDDQNYLKHYGRKGMKWYQHIFGKEQSHAKYAKDIPNTERIENYQKPLYFISDHKLENRKLKPRVPSNYFTKNGYEDSKTERVCFAPSVEQCLMGVGYRVAGRDYYVYEAPKGLTVYKPNKKAVPDSDITGEMWVTHPVEVSPFGVISNVKDKGEDGLPFTYGNGNKAELYEWSYDWKEKVI